MKGLFTIYTDMDITAGNLTLGKVGTPGEIKIRDSDNAGWTCCTALDGDLTCAVC